MVFTTTRNKRRRNKEYKQKYTEKQNIGGPVRSKRIHSSPLPAPKSGVSVLQLKKNLIEDLPTTINAKKFKSAEDVQDYDRIFLLDEIDDIDQLYLTEEQVDKMFRALHNSAANNVHKVKYFSADEILSESFQVPSTEDTHIIMVPIPLGSNGKINLAAFNLLTSTAWIFCRYYQQKHRLFDKIKIKLAGEYNMNFTLINKKKCDDLINTLPNSYNDVILIFRTAEELFFTGFVKKFEGFDLNAERKRYSEIYDMIRTNDWDGIWPPTLQSENREINEPDETEVEENESDRTNASFLSSDIQVIESSENDGETNTSNSTFNENRSIISGYNDFDDLHSPRPQIRVSNDSIYSTPISLSFNSSSYNVVDNQLNTSELPHNRPLVSYSVSDTSTISGRELITSSTQNSPSNLSNFGNENLVPSIIPSEQSNSDVTYSSGYTIDSGSVDYAWLARYAETAAIPHDEELRGAPYVVSRDWRRSLSPQRFEDEEIEDSSLSSGESSSESEDDEEINVELPPRYYNDDTNDSLNDEPNPEETDIIIQKCRGIFKNFKGYWGAVRKLAEDRQCIIKKLKKQLSKKRKFNDDQIIHINAKLKVIEEMLNSTIPIIPCWKVSYQNGSDKKIIIRKGYIYERIGETNRFKCVYKKNDTFEHCFSFIMIDNSDTIIEGSFCFHHHLPADNEKYTEDVPPAPATPISFCRVTKEEGVIMGKYSKLMKLLKEILIELIDWRSHVVVCLENLKLIHGYLNDLENTDDLRLSSSQNNPSLTVLAETKNLLKCIRLDTL